MAEEEDGWATLSRSDPLRAMSHVVQSIRPALARRSIPILICCIHAHLCRFTANETIMFSIENSGFCAK